jgi:hypothetical protein
MPASIMRGCGGDLINSNCVPEKQLLVLVGSMTVRTCTGGPASTSREDTRAHGGVQRRRSHRSILLAFVFQMMFPARSSAGNKTQGAQL